MPIGLLALAAGGLRAEAEWSEPNPQGLATRLVLLDERPEVGKPFRLRLEAKNTSAVPAFADIQSLAHTSCLLRCENEAGRAVPVISATLAGCQTIEDFRAFPAGKVVELAGGIDVAEEFEIAKPGVYRFRHPGVKAELPGPDGGEQRIEPNGEELRAGAVLAGIPASPVLEVKVAPGELPPDLEMITRLRPVLPQGWFLCRRWNGPGAHLGRHGPDGSVSIELVAAERGAPLEAGHHALGASPLGEIRIGVEVLNGKGGQQVPPGAQLDDHWKGASEAIRKALEIAPSEA